MEFHGCQVYRMAPVGVGKRWRAPRALCLCPRCFKHPAPPTAPPRQHPPASAPKQTPRKRGPLLRALFPPCWRGGALAVRGVVLCRATPSCPFVLPVLFNMPFCFRLWLSPLACAFGLRLLGIGRRAPLRGARTRGCVASPRALFASLRSPASSASLRPPALSKTLPLQKRGFGRAVRPLSGRCPEKAVALARPSPRLRALRALRLHSLGGLRWVCRVGCVGRVCRAGVGRVCRIGAPRLTDTPALLARERDVTLTLP